MELRFVSLQNRHSCRLSEQFQNALKHRKNLASWEVASFHYLLINSNLAKVLTNSFSFEIFGNKGFLNISGLGGSYGDEILKIGLRSPDGGLPEIEMHEFSDYDKSWVLEWNDFKDAINTNKYTAFSGVDGYAVNKVVEAIYNSNRLNKLVPVA